MKTKTCDPKQSRPSSINNDSEQKERALSSCIKVSPHTHSHPTFLDGASLLSSAVGTPGSELQVNLPLDLTRTFGISKVRLRESGYIKSKPSIETNGTLVDRVTLGLADPVVDPALLNQIHADEAPIWGRHQGTLTPYKTQINDLIATYHNYYSYLDQLLGGIKLLPQKLVRCEFYREYTSPQVETELFTKLELVLGRMFGRPRLRDNGVGDLGECRAYIIPTPALKRLTSRNQWCGVKLYRKGNRIRAEVEFVNFSVPGLRAHNYPPFKINQALPLIQTYMEELALFAETVLDVVQDAFFSSPVFVDVASLQRKLITSYGMKKVHDNPAIVAFVRSLETKGYYCRREIPKGSRLSAAQMTILKQPVTGILEPIPRPKTGKKPHLSFRLKEGWETVIAPVKKPRAATAEQVAEAAINAVKAAVRLPDGVESKVEAVIRLSIKTAMRRSRTPELPEESGTATVEA
jgi:hypothetical protein